MKITRKLNYNYNWYYNFLVSLTIIESFLIDSESEIANRTKEIEKRISKEFEKDSEEYYTYYEIYNKLDSSTFNIREVVSKDFPNIQRKSILITALSFFEREINKLCIELKEMKNIKVSLKDLNTQGLPRAIIYLEKVIEIPIDKNNKTYKRISDINKIRNLIVHNNGYLYNNENTLKEEDKIIKKTSYLSGEYEIQIEKGYIEYVIETYKIYFKYIDSLVRNHLDGSSLASRRI